MKTFVSYDIVEDKVRRKVFEACKDYGLLHVQYSFFFGNLTRNRREELYQRLRRIIGRREGKVLICPICDKDLRLLKEIEVSDAMPKEAAEAPATYQAGTRKKVRAG
jgi:CRISPR-associated protein Cas2